MNILMALLVMVLAGCGQKGPLYLPDEGGEVVTRPGGQTQQQSPETAPTPGTTDPKEEAKKAPTQR
jgi:predicted small lipoprotein YifL